MNNPHQCWADFCFQKDHMGNICVRETSIPILCDATLSGWSNLWQHWNEGKVSVLYLCLSHAQSQHLEW